MFGLHPAPRRPLAVAFDVIGTLFPLEPMRARLIGLGLPASALEGWFAAALRDAFALAAAGEFQSFAKLQAAALDEVLAAHDLHPDKAERHAVLEAMGRLAARPDAEAALGVLEASAIPRLALSNGAKAATEHLLESAGLEGGFAKVLSVEQVKRAKPDARVYRRAAKVMEVETGDLALIAVHPWDVHGAKAAGLTTGFVRTREHPRPEWMHAPDVEGDSLFEVANALAALPA